MITNTVARDRSVIIISSVRRLSPSDSFLQFFIFNSSIHPLKIKRETWETPSFLFAKVSLDRNERTRTSRAIHALHKTYNDDDAGRKIFGTPAYARGNGGEKTSKVCTVPSPAGQRAVDRTLDCERRDTICSHPRVKTRRRRKDSHSRFPRNMSQQSTLQASLRGVK